MYGKLKNQLQEELETIKVSGLYKKERVIVTPQHADIQVESGSNVLNFCANNYLGLSSDKKVVEAAKKALDKRGFGLSSVLCCSTQDIHKQLENKLSDFLGGRYHTVLLHLMLMEFV